MYKRTISEYQEHLLVINKIDSTVQGPKYITASIKRSIISRSSAAFTRAEVSIGTVKSGRPVMPRRSVIPNKCQICTHLGTCNLIEGIIKAAPYYDSVPMPEDVGKKQSFNHIVAFIDILGSSQILKSNDEKAIADYLRGIDGLYLSSLSNVSDGVKMFSDNILIYSEGATEEDAQSVISSVAHIQWSVMKEFNLFIRGGVVMDRLDKIPEEESDYIIGKAIVEAHELESTKAIYPRVVVSEEVAELCSGPGSLIKTDWDCPFIDYLRMSIEEGFVSDDLETYRQSLVAHIDNNNRMRGCKPHDWDRIRDKDVWALSYYNNFCSINDRKDLIIAFGENYDVLSKRIAICINSSEGGE